MVVLDPGGNGSRIVAVTLPSSLREKERLKVEIMAKDDSSNVWNVLLTFVTLMLLIPEYLDFAARFVLSRDLNEAFGYLIALNAMLAIMVFVSRYIKDIAPSYATNEYILRLSKAIILVIVSLIFVHMLAWTSFFYFHSLDIYSKHTVVEAMVAINYATWLLFELYGIEILGVEGLDRSLTRVAFAVMLIVLPLLVILIAMWFPGPTMLTLLVVIIVSAAYSLWENIKTYG